MHRRRRVVLISCVVLLLLVFQPAQADDGCPSGWEPMGGWYQEGDTCKLRCTHSGQPDWWMDSGGEARVGCGGSRDAAPTYFDLWGYAQAPLCDCPPGYEPEHVWFRQGDTCLLECVNKANVDLLIDAGFDRRGWLDIPLPEKQIYVDSGGESRPPWCILED